MTGLFYFRKRKMILSFNDPVILFAVACLLIAGCMAPKEPAEPVVDAAETLTFLEAGLRPEVLLFPDYLLMEDFQLFQHGRITQTNLIGAGMKTDFDLATVRRQFSDVLASKGWKTDKMEMGKQSFRQMASLQGETLEIRAVQGTGPTQVFILYRTKKGVKEF